MFEFASPPGNSFRFVRAWRGAVRDHWTIGGGAPIDGCCSCCCCGSFPLTFGLVWLGSVALVLVRLCVWLLVWVWVFRFPAPLAFAFALALVRFCAWLLAFVLVFGFWFLVVRRVAR